MNLLILITGAALYLVFMLPTELWQAFTAIAGLIMIVWSLLRLTEVKDKA